MIPPETSRLQYELDRITANTRALVQPERLAITESAVQELFTTGIEDCILTVGRKRQPSHSPTPSAASLFTPPTSSA